MADPAAFTARDHPLDRARRLNLLRDRVTALEAGGGGGGGAVTSVNTRTGAVTIVSADVTTALGFTPYGPNTVNILANPAAGQPTGMGINNADGSFARLKNDADGKPGYIEWAGPGGATYGYVGWKNANNRHDFATAIPVEFNRTPYVGSVKVSLEGHSHAESDITGLAADLAAKLNAAAVSAFGLTLVDDADAVTARGTLGLGTAATLAFDTDTALAANSDAKVATQKATKAYVDSAVAGLLDYRGGVACAANPNYPTALKGDAYNVTTAGKIGGAAGKSVDIGDVVVATTDNAGGTEAAVGTSWIVLEHNLTGALVASNNLSDLANPATARTNLGLAAIASSGSASDLGAGTVPAGRMPALTGDVTTAGGAVATTIANNAVSYAKMQDISATQRVLGRNSAAAGDPEEVTLTQLLDWIGGATRGDLLTRGISNWTRLPVGASNQVLTAGSDLFWSDNSGGWTEKTLASDCIAANSATFADITDGSTSFVFTPITNKSYEVQAVLMLETTSAANLPRIGVHVLAQGTGAFGCCQIDQTGATTTTRVTQDGTWTTTAVDVQVPAGGLAAANTPYMCFVTIRGRSASFSNNITIQLACETAAANTCKVRAGSIFRVRHTA